MCSQQSAVAADGARDMQNEMEQPLNPVSLPPQSFESRLSRVKAWTLAPTFCGAFLAGPFIGRAPRDTLEGTCRSGPRGDDPLACLPATPG